MKTLILSILLVIGIFSLNAQVKVASNLNVGVGIDAPLEKLHINGSVRGNQTGSLRISTGNGYIDVGPKNDAGFAHIYSDRTYFIFNKDVWSINGGFSAYSTGNLLLKTNNTTRVTINYSNGYTGIGMAPSYMLDVNGVVRATSYSTGSDIRLKKDVMNLDKSAINKIMELEAITYKPILKHKNPMYISQPFRLTSDTIAVDSVANIESQEEDPILSKTMIGFSAQEVQKHFPDLVSEDQEGYLSVNYIGLIPVLVEAIKQQQVEIDNLKKQLNPIP